MASILDSILDNVGRNEVISEQHDVNKINVGAVAASKPSDGLRQQIESLRNGGWDEAEYGISRQAQIAKLETALAEAVAFEATPEGMEAARVAVEKAINEMRQRAINRAGLFVRNGRVSVAVAGQSAWHGLGINVRDVMNSKEAMTQGNLNVTVLKTPLEFKGEDDLYHVAEGLFGLRYVESSEILYAPITDRYQPIQNKDAFDFMDGVAGEFGAKYEAVGAINGGRKVFLLMHMPNQSFSVNGDDRSEAYVLLTNTHGGEAAWCFGTNERTVCANTVRRAMGGKKKGISLRHTGNIQNKISAARQALGLAVKGFNEYKETAEAMTQAKVVPVKYFDVVLDDFLAFTEAEEALRRGNLLEAVTLQTEAERKLTEKSLETKLKRKDLLLDQMLEAYGRETNAVNGMRGSVWAAYNAVTEVTSHGKTDLKQSRDPLKRREKRFESIIDGERDDLAQAAYQQAVALAV